MSLDYSVNETTMSFDMKLGAHSKAKEGSEHLSKVVVSGVSFCKWFACPSIRLFLET